MTERAKKSHRWCENERRPGDRHHYPMLISKFLAYFFHPLDAAARTMREERWTFAAFCYMGCAFMSVLIPMPRLGAYSLSGNGIWQQLPERALCAAAVYFSLLGFYELYFHSRKPK